MNPIQPVVPRVKYSGRRTMTGCRKKTQSTMNHRVF